MTNAGLSRPDLERLVDLLNVFVRQFPRIGAELLSREVLSTADEILSCAPRSTYTGAKLRMDDGTEPLDLGWNCHGPGVDPAWVGLHHVLTAIAGDHATVRLRWDKACPAWW